MRLLIVEDNAELSRLVAAGLAAAGYQSDIVGSAAEAREAVSSVSYAAMILDLGLPDGDGLSVLRELRLKMEPLPVLVLTARGGLQDRVSGLRSGADDYLAKPFAMEELIARLEAMEEWTRSLAGVLTVGVGLEEALVATLRSTPGSIRPEVAQLVARLRARWSVGGHGKVPIGGHESAHWWP